MRLLVLPALAEVSEGGLATPGAEVMTTPGVGTVEPAATPEPMGGAEDLAETAEAVDTTPTPTP